MQNPQNYELPAMVAQQAEAYALGTPFGTYQPRLGSKPAVFGMMIGVIIADIILLIIIATLTGYVFYILILIPIVAIIYGFSAFSSTDLRVYAFPNGLIHAKGDKVDPIRWDRVTSVIQQQRQRRNYIWGGLLGGAAGALIASGASSTQSITVQRDDGAVFKFTNTLKNVAQLSQNIQQAVTQQHMPKAIATYNSGAPISFGSLTVSLQGLNNGRETVFWNEVQSVEIKQGVVIIRKANKTLAWAKLNISQIPNVLVFTQLVNYARTGLAA